MESPHIARWLTGAALASIVVHASPARADTAAAEVLFEEGRRLLGEGKFAEACPKLKESHRIDPGVGVLLYLGDCYVGNGQTASAWSAYREAEAAARAARQADRETIAREKAAALAPKLSRVVLTPAAGLDTAGMEIRLGEQTFTSATLGVAVPVDPGRYELEVRPRGKASWTQSLEVPAGGGETRVELAPPAEGSTGAPVATTPTAPPDDEPRETWSGQKTAAIVVLGVGVAGVAMGSVFGIMAASSWSDADAACGPGDPRQCSPEGAEAGEDASTSALVSTIGFGVGAAAIVGAGVLWFTAPDGGSETALRVRPAVGPGGVALDVKGRF
jgi:hypothetical protein